MVFLNSQETKAQLPLIFALDAKVFGADLVFNLSEQVKDRINSPMSLYASALSQDTQEMVAYVCMTVVNERYYQKLLRGEAKEDEFEPWDEKDTPLLFFRCLVVKDRRAAPYIFRSVLKELHQLIVDYELYIHRVFTIGSHWVTRRALKAYQFEEVGKYKGKYPILLASRDKSAVVNSYLKRYGD